ncbi:hypothetical protein BN1723_006400 [Verticillium longisporum]|uniref:CN hydrolase domain-containing protein n=2 Tax=Verticillium longisporum TaxID=100787 RepID=A0A0G4NFD6_VERLO|nr:hypothetical protein BN1723_006400 [Verticillium longisporum]
MHVKEVRGEFGIRMTGLSAVRRCDGMRADVRPGFSIYGMPCRRRSEEISADVTLIIIILPYFFTSFSLLFSVRVDGAVSTFIMARHSITLSILSLAALVTARNCHDLSVSLDVSATNKAFDLAVPTTDIEITDIILQVTRQGGNFISDITTGETHISGNYELAATYCEPDHGPSKVLQILTHGIGFDRHYWDFPANNYNYSYTKTAVDEYGYSTFTYDRLGVGESSHGEPISEIQQALELAALKVLTQKLRASELSGLEDKHFDKIVHVGHSFGSVQTYGLTVDDKDACLSDGIVLTGFSQNGTFLPYFLLGGNFVQANSLPPLADYADGYVAPSYASPGAPSTPGVTTPAATPVYPATQQAPQIPAQSSYTTPYPNGNGSSNGSTTPTIALPESRPTPPPTGPPYDVTDSLAGTGIDLRAEEQYLAELFAVEPSISDSRTGFSIQNPGNKASFYGAGSANQAVQPNGGKSQDQVIAEAAEKAWQASAKALSAERVVELNSAFLVVPNVQGRAESIAKEHGLTLNWDMKASQPMGKIKVMDEHPKPVKVSTKVGPDGAVIKTSGTWIPHDAYLADQLALLSIASKQRLRSLIEDAHRIAVTRQQSSHGEVPDEWKEAAGPLNTTPAESNGEGNDVGGKADSSTHPLKRSLSAADSANGNRPAKLRKAQLANATTVNRDVPFCGGDCSATGDPQLKSILDTSSQFLQQAQPFEAYVVKGAGHGLALEYSHVETTGKILDFFVQNGLAAQFLFLDSSLLPRLADVMPQVIHFVKAGHSGPSLLPALVAGRKPPPHEDSSALDTGNYSQPPCAIVLGGAFDDAATEALRSAVEERNESARRVPWLRHDTTKKAPPLGTPEYAQAVVQRVKATLTRLEAEGKLNGENGDVEWLFRLFFGHWDIMAIAAIGQICSTASLAHNLEQCVRLVAKAAAGNAKVLFLPEAADYIASSPQESLALALPQDQSPFVIGLQDAARKHSLAVNVGIHVAADGISSKLLNRSLWINSDGTINHAATYDKLHLFDYGSLRESATVRPGTALTAPFASPLGLNIGSLICFDLRFPEPALALAQPGAGSPFAATKAHVLLYPSAFTPRTGRAHWEVLLRARAIETQSWIVAAAQVGRHNGKRSSYGHSLVVDPWGSVKLELGGVDSEGTAEEGAEGAIGFVDIDVEVVNKVREEMPLARRMDVYPAH